MTIKPTSALVIDDDQVVLNLVESYLHQDGFTDVVCCDNGDDGWQRLREGNFDLIVLDWKLPGVAGLALFNRIRSLAELRLCPVLVISGFVDRDDFRLLEEFPCTALVEKPFTKTRFSRAIDRLTRERQWYTEQESSIAELFSFAQGNVRKAEAQAAKLVRESPNPFPVAIMASRTLAEHGFLNSAAKALKSLLKFDPNHVIANNELGKVYIRQGRYKQAVECLLQAHSVSPQNVQRLCLLGEADLNLRHPESAREHFSSAVNIDDKLEIAKSGITVANNMERALASPERRSAPKTFASLMNTLGVALVRSGDIERGLNHYRSALPFLNSDVDAARLTFNLGLGYLRWGKPDQALPWFEKSQGLGAQKFKKGRDYVIRIKDKGVKAVPDLVEVGIDDDDLFEESIAAKPVRSKPQPAAENESAEHDGADAVPAAPKEQQAPRASELGILAEKEPAASSEDSDVLDVVQQMSTNDQDPDGIDVSDTEDDVIAL